MIKNDLEQTSYLADSNVPDQLEEIQSAEDSQNRVTDPTDFSYCRCLA